MKLYLGLLESSLPEETRVFAEIDAKLIDLKLAYATLLAQDRSVGAYDLAGYYFPNTIATLLERGAPGRKVLHQVSEFVSRVGAAELRGPAGQKIAYDAAEIRLLPPLPNPQKSFVIGFADRVRTEALPKAEIPTAFYKLPQTFVTQGAPVVWPKFSRELDADACLAIVIGRAGKRIAPEKAWDYVAGVTMLIDITARDVNRREGLTTNNLLGKNFPSSACLGPSVRIGESRKDLESVELELSLDGDVKQTFSLHDCVFSAEQMIAHWSILGVKPGDWLAIGASMSRKGDRLQNPVPLKIESTLRCASPALGALNHRVVASAGKSA